MRRFVVRVVRRGFACRALRMRRVVRVRVSYRSPFRCVRRCVGNALAVSVRSYRRSFACIARRIGVRAPYRFACVGACRYAVRRRACIRCVVRCVACVAVRMRSLVAVRFPCAVSCVSVRRVCPAPTGRLRVRLPCVCVSVSVRRACAYRRRAYRRRALPFARRACIGASVLRRSSVRFGACASSFVVGAYVRCVVRVVSASVRSVVRSRRCFVSCVAFVGASCRAWRVRVVRRACVGSCAVFARRAPTGRLRGRSPCTALRRVVRSAPSCRGSCAYPLRRACLASCRGCYGVSCACASVVR